MNIDAQSQNLRGDFAALHDGPGGGDAILGDDGLSLLKEGEGRNPGAVFGAELRVGVVQLALLPLFPERIHHGEDFAGGCYGGGRLDNGFPAHEFFDDFR